MVNCAKNYSFFYNYYTLFYILCDSKFSSGKPTSMYFQNPSLADIPLKKGFEEGGQHKYLNQYTIKCGVSPEHLIFLVFYGFP